MFDSLLMKNERIVEVTDNVGVSVMAMPPYSLAITTRRAVWVSQRMVVEEFIKDAFSFIELDDIDSVDVTHNTVVQCILKSRDQICFSVKSGNLAWRLSHALADAIQNTNLVIEEILDTDETLRYKCERPLRSVAPDPWPGAYESFMDRVFESSLGEFRLCITDRHLILYQLSQPLRYVGRGMWVVESPCLNYRKTLLRDATLTFRKNMWGPPFLKLRTPETTFQCNFFRKDFEQIRCKILSAVE